MIDRKSWTISELVIMRYPAAKKELMEEMDVVMTKDPERKGTGSSGTGDPTSSPAIKLTDNVRFQRLFRETTAVEQALTELNDMEKKVVRCRFWQSKEYRRYPYSRMDDIPMSERSLKRAIKKMVTKVAKNLGEI